MKTMVGLLTTAWRMVLGLGLWGGMFSAVVPEGARAEASCQVQTGKLVMRYAQNDPAFKYYLYIPTGVMANAPLFVSVHGISRNAKEHAKSFKSLARRYGVVLIVPYFSQRYFKDYQRLGRAGRGRRADYALQLITNEVKQLLNFSQDSKLYMFGYSGGGQFVHRFAMAHPDTVQRFAIGAAGWYTYPDKRQRFPYGTQSVASLQDLNFSAERFLRVPACVLVGQWDIASDPALNNSRRIVRLQGLSRLERGQRWIAAMNRAAAEHGFDTQYGFKIIQGVGHDFTRSMRQGGLGRRVFEYLFAAAGVDSSASKSLTLTATAQCKSVLCVSSRRVASSSPKSTS